MRFRFNGSLVFFLTFSRRSRPIGFARGNCLGTTVLVLEGNGRVYARLFTTKKARRVVEPDSGEQRAQGGLGMPHRSSLFSSSLSILLPLRIRSFPLAPFIRLPRRLFLFRLYSAPARNAGSLRSFITEAPVHIRRIPVSCSPAIDKVIPITESCSSLISDRYNHKPSCSLSLSLYLPFKTLFVPR